MNPTLSWLSGVTLGGSLALLLNAPLHGAPAAPDQAPATHVEIESKFLEVTPAVARQMFQTSPTGDQRSIFEPEEIQAIFQRLNELKGVDLASAPKVTTRSGQRAKVEIVREFRYPTEFVLAKDNRTPTPTAFETKNVGLTLNIEPLIKPDGRILCEMAPEVVEFLGFINYGEDHPDRTSLKGDALNEALLPGTETGQTINQPVFQTRKVQTTVSLRSGETVLLGGLSRREKQVVTDLVGGKQQRNEQEIERVLYIFVTLRLVGEDGIPHEIPKRTKMPGPGQPPAASPALVPPPVTPATNSDTVRPGR